MLARFVATIVLGAMAIQAGAVAPRDVEKATAAYDRGDYQTAIDSYHALLAAGHRNGHVYYNLGNALFRNAQPGPALAAFLKARDYLPRDPDVQANMALVQRRATDKLATQGQRPVWMNMIFWVHVTTMKEQVYAVALAGLLTCFSLAAWIFWRREWLLWLTLGGGSLLILSGTGVGVRLDRPEVWGAVKVEKVQVYSGPNKITNSILFELHEAAPVMVRKEQNDWWQIKISDGKKGWLPKASLALYQ